MTEADVPTDAKQTPTPALRFKMAGNGRHRLQQRYRIETNKTLFYLWRFVPVVDEEAED